MNKKKKIKNQKSFRKKLYMFTTLFLLIFICLSMYIFFFKKDDVNTTISSKDGFKSEVFEDVYLVTSYLDSQKSNKGFNELYIDLDKDLDFDNSKETNNIDKSSNSEAVINTTYNLQISFNEKTGNPFFKINNDLAVFTVYSYTENKSKDLKKEDRIRKFEGEIFFVSSDGTVESTGTRNAVFVDMYETEEGIFLKEKLYFSGYENIPSWDRPHKIFIYKLTGKELSEVDSYEVYNFDGEKNEITEEIVDENSLLNENEN